MNLPSPFEKILNKEAPPDLGTGDMSIFGIPGKQF